MKGVKRVPSYEMVEKKKGAVGGKEGLDSRPPLFDFLSFDRPRPL